MPDPSSVPLLAINFQAIRDFFHDGGIFMYALALTSFVALAAIVFKVLSLRREAVIPAQLERDLDQLGQRAANGQAEGLISRFGEGSTLARLCGVAVEHRGKSRADITEAVQASAKDEIVQLNSGMTILDTVITVAPLFGLLGTASGLVVIFQGLGETTDHDIVARGIARALDNTIVGLAIAVPAVVAHGWFSRRIEVLTSRLEMLLAKVARTLEGAPVPASQPNLPRVPEKP
ncbi:MotA/TolQ/ExbB proton channel family protein [Luteolibacter luteus]|uniref:MotA/TolQ/ExbB proton channel family protein n=1 Tax=Luteolibacter luteus TaxID=2728835 RepID=A0A858RLL0_9BACT|nr:MotA/TolQ/ExbB proton channel family protein [Luteolibacter luteus]QJE97269.1 MotA/TolQ/ExbB proton channel family protein [Luteolibacter luteus]